MTLDAGVVALVLLSAVLHAAWNTWVKVGDDRLMACAVIAATPAAVAAVMLPLLPAPAPASWPFLGLAATVQTAYFLLLIEAYRFGDLSHVYPLARGTAPLVVAALVGLVPGERLSATQLVGVGAISLGILSLSLTGGGARGRDGRATLFALATGVAIATYTLLDGVGVRRAGTVAGYLGWVFLLDGIPMVAIALVTRGTAAVEYVRRHWRPGVVGGLMTLVAYGLVVWALSLGAIAPIAALRETSVVFAAISGAVFLGEPFGRRRVGAAALVAAGVILLNLDR